MNAFRKFWPLFFLLMIISCGDAVPAPAHKLSKKEMAAIFADLAVYDNSYLIKPKVDMRGTTQFVLQNHHVTAKVFMDNYNYYVSRSEDFDDILDESQQMLFEKDPGLKKYLEKDKLPGAAPVEH